MRLNYVIRENFMNHQVHGTRYRDTIILQHIHIRILTNTHTNDVTPHNRYKACSSDYDGTAQVHNPEYKNQ